MTPAERNVATYHAHRALFDEVEAHNLEVMNRRRKGGCWDAPENQYRNAWLEIEAAQAATMEG